MMEEVSDDTNGESTFEFVGGKSDENSVKDTQGPQETDTSPPGPPGGLFQPPPPSTQTPFFPRVTQPPLAPSVSSPVPSATGGATNVQFYDPTQYEASKPLYTPFPAQTESFVPPPPPQNPYISQPESGQVPPVPVQTFQPAIPSQHSIPEVGISVPFPTAGIDPMLMQEGGGESGMWGWIKGNQFINKVAEKAKSSVDSVITTLDPGMKEIINSGGDISVIVASGNESKVSAVREAFQLVFGKATVQGMAVQASSIAPQPVGFSAGLKAAEERIGNIRQQGFLQGNHVIVAVENFVTELTPENWFDMGCLLLQDHASGISLQVYTEAVPVSSHFILQAKDQTPADYPLGWSGYAVTIGQIIGSAMGVHNSEWHQALTGVPRREILFLASKTLAGLYKAQLRR